MYKIIVSMFSDHNVTKFKTSSSKSWQICGYCGRGRLKFSRFEAVSGVRPGIWGCRLRPLPQHCCIKPLLPQQTSFPELEAARRGSFRFGNPGSQISLGKAGGPEGHCNAMARRQVAAHAFSLQPWEPFTQFRVGPSPNRDQRNVTASSWTSFQSPMPKIEYGKQPPLQPSPYALFP